MIFIKKSFPGPDCLDKKTDYRCGDVLSRLETDFFNKCYICQTSLVKSLDIEHHKPKSIYPKLEHSWENLFWACSHCNTAKGKGFTNILNCTKDKTIEDKIKYTYELGAPPVIKIESTDNNIKTHNTIELITKCLHGFGVNGRVEASSIRKQIEIEVQNFYRLLTEYFEAISGGHSQNYFLTLIKEQLKDDSTYVSIKRWIIKEDIKFSRENFI